MIPKTWGFEVPLFNGPYAAKFLVVLKGKYCSIHRHHLKDETFFIVKGDILLKCHNKHATLLQVGQTWRIEPHTWHRFRAMSEDAIILEVSTHDDPEDTERRELSIREPLVVPPENMREFLSKWLNI